MKKRIQAKKLTLQRETLAHLVGGWTSRYPTINDTVYSKSECVPASTACPSAGTDCTACIA